MAIPARPLIERWSDDQVKAIWKALSKGKDLGRLGVGRTEEGRWDLRGIRVPEVGLDAITVTDRFLIETLRDVVELKKVRLVGIDFSLAFMPYLRLSDSVVSDCVFEEADLTDLRIWRTEIVDCAFIRTVMKPCLLGGWGPGSKGSRVVRTLFAGVDLRELRSDAGEFVDVDFSDVAMDENRFQATVFENCRFSGALVDVMFDGRDLWRNDYPGRSLRNTMRGCDFSGAILEDVSFTGIDTRVMTLPADPKLLVIDDYAGVMQRALDYIQTLPADDPHREKPVVATFEEERDEVGPGLQNVFDMKGFDRDPAYERYGILVGDVLDRVLR